MLRCDFLILGLPRCRTAWLAQLFTSGDVFCWHDLSGLRGSMAEIQRQLDHTPARFVGLADTALHLWHQDIAAARIAYVRREPEASADALSHALGMTLPHTRDVVRIFDMALTECRAEHPGPLFDAAALDQAAVLAMWEHLIPDRPFPHHRYLQLQNTKVEILPSHLRAIARAGGPSMLSR